MNAKEFENRFAQEKGFESADEMYSLYTIGEGESVRQECMEAYHRHRVDSITDDMITDRSYHYTDKPNPFDFREGAKWLRDQLKADQ